MSDTAINTAPVKQKSNWPTFWIMMLGWFAMMLVLGANTTAFPFVTAKLGIDSSYVTWMSAAYTLGAAVLAPMMGRLSDMIGLKKVLVLGLVMFIVSLFGLGLGNHFAIILVARLLQGLSVACVVPSCLAFAGRFFKGAEAAKAYAIFGAVSTGGNVVGPFVAGSLCSSVGYHWVYLGGAVINIVVMIIVTIVAPKVPIVAQNKGKFDWAGSVCLFITVASVLILPTIGGQFGWGSPLAIVCMVLFVVFLIAFISVEKRVKNQLFRVELFKTRSFAVPAIHSLFCNGFVTVFMYMASYYVVAGRGLPSTVSGTWSSVIMIVMTLSAFLVTRIMKKVNWRTVAWIHVISTALAAVCFAIMKPTTPIYMLYLGGVLLGFSGAFNTPLPNASALEQIKAEERGVASGTFRMFNDMAGPLMTAIFIPLLSTINPTPEGYPNFAASFPVVSWLILIPMAIIFVIDFFYPKHDPKKDQAA